MISDFQLALIGLAIVIIVAVIIYNRWQESKYKKRAEQAFGGSHPDVLIDEPVSLAASGARNHVSERVEPKLGANLSGYAAEAAADDGDDLTPIDDTHSFAASANHSAAHAAHSSHSSRTSTSHTPTFSTSQLSQASPASSTAAPTTPMLHADIDCIALILADAPIEATQYENVINQSKLLGKGVRWEGLNGGLWQPITLQPTTLQPITLPAVDAYRELRVGLQLADRHGPVDGMVLNQFNDMVAQYAASVGAVSQREDIEAAIYRAQALDAFCADTDIEIAVNVIGKSGVTFAVTKVRGLAESNGLVALDSGEYVMQDEHGRTLYTLRNFDPAEPPGIKRSTGYLNGLTFAVDVPRTPDAARTFERMFLVVMKFADVLQGEVVDDNRKVLTAAGRKVISDTITTIAEQMQAKGVTAGSATALRLYA